MSAMANEIDDVVNAYMRWFGAPSRVVPGTIATAPRRPLALVAYLPSEEEKKDPEANLTLIGTAGLSSMPIATDFRTEMAIEVVGSPAEPDLEALGSALAEIACAPLKTGRPFRKGELLGNVQLPIFSAFQSALLVDWDPVDGFEFPKLDPPVSLLRLAPLYEDEAAKLQGSQDRTRKYLAWTLAGLAPADPGRRSIA